MRDIRELRRINKPLYTLMANIPLYREIDKFVMPLPKVLLEAMTTTLFKPLAILRPAYVMRVVTEEQFRIAAAGSDSFTNNPTGWLAWVFGRKSGRDLDLNMKSLYDSRKVPGSGLSGLRKVESLAQLTSLPRRAMICS